ncbi:MAG: hypothetical protein ABI860_10880, partial [Gemmatimonadales bacterium]
MQYNTLIEAPAFFEAPEMLNVSIREAAMHDGFSVSEVLTRPALPFTPAVEAELAPVWAKVQSRVTPLEWRLHA